MNAPKVLIDLRTTEYKFKPITGIYYLVYKELIVYIGKSTDVQARIKTHQKDNKKFDRVFISEFPSPEYMNYWEADHIRTFMPYYNGKGNKSKLSQRDHAELDEVYDQLLQYQQCIDMSLLYLDDWQAADEKTRQAYSDNHDKAVAMRKTLQFPSLYSEKSKEILKNGITI